jgi:aminotransferase
MKLQTTKREIIAEHVARIPRSGIRVISLGIGEPDFVTPWHIREAAIYALERGKTGYTSNLGSPALRKEIARHVEEHFGVRYEALSEVIVTVGVSEAIDIALRAILNPGDEVIFHEPCYVSYSPSIALAYGKAVAVSTRSEDGFSLRAEALEKVITPRTKAVMLNFPTNPTGAVLPRAEQEKIARLCCEQDLVVLTDEIYSDLTYARDHQSIASLPGMKERTIFLHGFSKAYAMTGFRIGYACAPAALTEAMMRIHQYSMLCASIISQEAALEALRHGEASAASMREQYEQRRNFLTHHINDMGLKCQKKRE